MQSKREKALFETIRQRLVAARKSGGMSQEQLAAKSGVDRVAIGYIEQARRKPTLNTLAKLADALEIKLSELFKRL